MEDGFRGGTQIGTVPQVGFFVPFVLLVSLEHDTLGVYYQVSLA